MKGLLKSEIKRAIFYTVFLPLIACGPNKQEWIKNVNQGGALGTSYAITYLSFEAQDYQFEIDSVFQVVNRSMSTYIPDSDISKINQGDTVVVDRMFRDVFELSKKVHHITGGYFDPTVGTLVNAWGFGPGEQIVLDSVKVDSLLSYVGFHKVHLTEDHKIIKQHPGIQFDFNAIAKGYAIDRLAAMLDEKGIENYLVEVGGEVVARGENKLKRKQWTVGVDDPQSLEERRLKQVVQLKDKALASSGNYRKFRIDPETGEKYVHTINPKTGYTKNSKVLATSVIANTCAKADAYATAFMAMELESSMELLKKEKELGAYIIYLDENGETIEYMTGNFKKLVAN